MNKIAEIKKTVERDGGSKAVTIPVVEDVLVKGDAKGSKFYSYGVSVDNWPQVVDWLGLDTLVDLAKGYLRKRAQAVADKYTVSRKEVELDNGTRKLVDMYDDALRTQHKDAILSALAEGVETGETLPELEERRDRLVAESQDASNTMSNCILGKPDSHGQVIPRDQATLAKLAQNVASITAKIAEIDKQIAARSANFAARRAGQKVGRIGSTVAN